MPWRSKQWLRGYATFFWGGAPADTQEKLSFPEYVDRVVAHVPGSWATDASYESPRTKQRCEEILNCLTEYLSQAVATPAEWELLFDCLEGVIEEMVFRV